MSYRLSSNCIKIRFQYSVTFFSADEWPGSKEKLISKGDSGINIWTCDLGSKVGQLYLQQWPDKPNENLLHLIPTLTHQVVSEESESGNKVESEIDVPQYLRKRFSKAPKIFFSQTFF